jgi:HD-GYP domain-containing protein (c-di-GMP phosphodiesterase class II)
MAQIPIESVKTGQSYQEDIRDKNGAVLIPARTEVTTDLYQWMAARSLFYVYSDDPVLLARKAVKEAKSLKPVRSNLKAMDEALDELEYQLYKSAKAIKNPRIRPSGAWYHNNTRFKTLDSRLTYFPGWDRPKGRSLSRNLNIAPDRRSDKYKQDFLNSYSSVLTDAKTMIDKIADGTLPDARPVMLLAEKVVKQFLKDKNLLFNCSLIKSSSNENLYHHALNVCILAVNIAISTGYNYDQTLEIGVGALLHDIGMIFVGPDIRYKAGPLTAEEFSLIQKHPLDGLFPISKIKGLPEAVEYIIYQHHEREDGSGYPKARKRERMHRYARIVALADVFDAMTCPRPYRHAMHPYQAMLELLGMVREGKISSDLMRFFIEYSSLFPVGSYVKLNDGRIAKVINASGKKYVAPVVAVVDNIGSKFQGDTINLAKNPDIKVVDAIPAKDVPDITLLDGF